MPVKYNIYYPDNIFYACEEEAFLKTQFLLIYSQNHASSLPDVYVGVGGYVGDAVCALVYDRVYRGSVLLARLENQRC